MSLVYPSFLWALLALAIPIVIHLFNFRKTIRLYFSNTRFLKQVKEETTQKRRLKQFLVLASRLLFLFFLVIAFAQPFLPARDEMTHPQRIVIYVDNSFSMASPVAEKTRALDEAVRMAQSIVDLFPPSTQFQLLTNEFAPFSNSFKAKTEVADQLSQIKLSAITRSASEILSRVTDPQATFFGFLIFKSRLSENQKSILRCKSVLHLYSWKNIQMYLSIPFIWKTLSLFVAKKIQSKSGSTIPVKKISKD